MLKNQEHVREEGECSACSGLERLARESGRALVILTLAFENPRSKPKNLRYCSATNQNHFLEYARRRESAQQTDHFKRCVLQARTVSCDFKHFGLRNSLPDVALNNKRH